MPKVHQEPLGLQSSSDRSEHRLKYSQQVRQLARELGIKIEVAVVYAEHLQMPLQDER